MGIMDKIKVQADQLAKQAQQGVATGQTKLNELQAKRAADALLHDLGAAVYAAQRQGGPHEPIETIMAALDAHAAANGAIDTTINPKSTTATGAATPPPTDNPPPSPSSRHPPADTPPAEGQS